MEDKEKLLFHHGGYRKLKSFQLAQLCFDITVRFVELYIPPKSRTTDQMVQAARSGVQNIAEGSVASATSKRTELKLTNVARASLEELRLDYEDYLRQHAITVWSKEHPLTQEFIRRRISSMENFRNFIQWAKLHDSAMSVKVRTCPLQSVIVANGALLLLDTTCYLLDRQLARLAADFENEGGFSERMCQRRTEKRKECNK
ncbi:MAG: four helix bundle protein [Lentisphaerae bacterium]|nr:four helix bundle protein [Lentisphaerota bacterium]